MRTDPPKHFFFSTGRGTFSFRCLKKKMGGALPNWQPSFFPVQPDGSIIVKQTR